MSKTDVQKKGNTMRKLAFIGLGEVGSNVTIGLAQKGVSVKGYDIKFDTEGKEKFQKCADAGVVLVDTPEELIDGADIIIAVTSCSQALATAKMYKPYLKKEQVYCEFNSTVPDAVKEVQEYIGDACTFIDGCVLVSANIHKEKSPCCSSGPAAEAITKELNDMGMNIRYLGDSIGQASAFKVIRSIFTKNLEATLIETMTCARYYGVEDIIFDSIVTFLSDAPLDVTLPMMIKTNAVHAHRRGEEIEEIAVMQKEAGLDNTMSEAATKKMFWLAGLGLNKRFGGKPTADMNEFCDVLLEIQGKR